MEINNKETELDVLKKSQDVKDELFEKDLLEKVVEHEDDHTEDQDNFALNTGSSISNEYFEIVCEQISNMNFIEARKMLKELKDTKQQLEDAKSTADAIYSAYDEMQNAVEASEASELSDSDKINVANVEVNNDISDLKKFIANFDDTMSKIDQLVEKADQKVHEFDHIEKTTSYLTQCALELIDRNQKNLHEDMVDYKRLSIYYKELRSIFEHRTDINFILEKIPSTRILLRRAIQSLKKNKNFAKNFKKTILKTFGRVFTVKDMNTFENYLLERYDSPDTFYMIYTLYLIYTQEIRFNKYGKHKWIEIFIMNTIDLSKGTFDLEEGKDAYLEKMDLIHDTIMKMK